ncbi:protein kinase family protein [Thermomonospora echinospora]|uniref:hypothetical protein n=1 Tax=Thermomonospora echinospora TaxID=1992 RepID=UPI0011B02CC8|nr:hypothetical protein [Thermomonospora echinospora]
MTTELIGTPVFDETTDNLTALTPAHVQDDPPKLRELRSDVPEDIERLVLELLAKSPEERPGLAAAVKAQRLGAVLGDDQPVPPGPLPDGVLAGRLHLVGLKSADRTVAPGLRRGAR